MSAVVVVGSALAEGKALDKAISFANAAGALATTRRRAQESLPGRTAINAFLSSGQ